MKVCKNCAAEFEIPGEDRAFYRKMDVPEPTWCPECRMQRRLAFRNERKLYKRKCDLTGKEMISCFAPEKPLVIYDNDAWWTDRWNALEYGRDFDFSRPFFEQFFELRSLVPRLARQQQQPIENCEYANCIGHCKNCYLMFSTNKSEDCCYGTWVNHCRDAVDNQNLQFCELCYECIDCRDSHNLRWCQDCVNCHDSSFLINCIGCKDCFLSTNLKNQQYVIRNTPMSKAEYQKSISDILSRSAEVLEALKRDIADMKATMTVKSFHGVNTENVSGDYLRNCKNTHGSYDCDNTEDVRYATCVEYAKDSMDYSHWGMNAELIYECHACGYDVSHLRFCNLCWGGCHDLLYSDHCFKSAYAFGCVGLKNEQYCILNKRYSKEEYERLVPRIIEHMQQIGEWGEFFPVSRSLFAYNESIAQEYFPLSKAEISQKGWIWKDEEEPDFSGITRKIPAQKLPEKITDIPDDILNWAIECAQSKKLFRIQKPELEFYRKMNLPIPKYHPEVRHQKRMAFRNPRKLWSRNCTNCQQEIQTTYRPDRSETVYCEACYLAAVY